MALEHMCIYYTLPKENVEAEDDEVEQVGRAGQERKRLFPLRFNLHNINIQH